MSIQTDPKPHLASYTMGTGSFSWRVEQVGHGADNPHPSCAKVANVLELYLHLPSFPVCHGTYAVIMCHKIILISLSCLYSCESVSRAWVSFKCVAAEERLRMIDLEDHGLNIQC